MGQDVDTRSGTTSGRDDIDGFSLRGPCLLQHDAGSVAASVSHVQLITIVQLAKRY